ncbi:MAG TPA: FtsX-like permease family protein [Gemmatimonadales bacterium]|nr:FtsX-like permease family protein [Gemmatimonadales bacterium]
MTVITMRGAAASALWGLRAHRGTAALLVGFGALGLAATLPVALMVGAGGSLLTPRLLLPGADLVADPEWALARTPAALQREGLTLLFHGLAGAALTGFIVSALGVLLLFAARAGERRGEMILRRAVGASGRTLLLATLLEGGVIAVAALMVGIVAGWAGAKAAVTAWPGAVGPLASEPAALTILAMPAVVLTAAALALLFAPRRRLTDTSGRPLGLAVPAAQLGLASIMLTAGGLLGRHSDGRPIASFERVAGRQIVTARSADPVAQSRSASYKALLRSLESGGSDTVSLASDGVTLGLGTVSVATTDCGLCSFGGVMVPWHAVAAAHRFVSADSFQALGVGVVEGRGLTDADDWQAPRVAVVSRALALQHFQDGQAVGRRMLLGDDVRTWHTVVGVVDVPPSQAIGAAMLPVYSVYGSVLQHPPSQIELLLTPRPGVTMPKLKGTVAAALGVRADQVSATTEARLLAGDRAPVDWFGTMLEIEGSAALIVAVLATVVQLRLWVRSSEPELGLRRAVGARGRDIVALLVLRAGMVAAGGIAVGLWLGPVAWGALGTIVAGLPGWDTGLVMRYASMLVAATLAAALVPGYRASRQPPARLLDSGA